MAHCHGFPVVPLCVCFFPSMVAMCLCFLVPCAAVVVVLCLLPGPAPLLSAPPACAPPLISSRCFSFSLSAFRPLCLLMFSLLIMFGFFGPSWTGLFYHPLRHPHFLDSVQSDLNKSNSRLH
ncbi:hypothetical protein SRHO_G00247030, partial [Serrasalmus rhombeus]